MAKQDIIQKDCSICNECQYLTETKYKVVHAGVSLSNLSLKHHMEKNYVSDLSTIPVCGCTRFHDKGHCASTKKPSQINTGAPIPQHQVNYKSKLNYTWCSTKILALYSLSTFSLSTPGVSHLLSLQLLRRIKHWVTPVKYKPKPTQINKFKLKYALKLLFSK